MAVLSRRSPEREQARRERHAAVRARIIDATNALIREGANYASLSVETIAARSGISRTTFYDYFPDKRELLLAMSRDVFAAPTSALDEYRIPADAGEAKVRGREMLAGFVEAYRHPAVRAIVEATFYDEAVAAAWRANMEQQIGRAVALLEAEDAAGNLRADGSTLEARARVLHWAVHATIFQEIVLHDAVPQADLTDAIVDVWLRATRGSLP